MMITKRSIVFIKTYCLTMALAILPIILFVPRYVDDYGRGHLGNYAWTKSGFRPLADWLYWTFNLAGPSTALAPLGQLASIPISGLAALAISRSFQVSNPLLAVAATLPVFVNPYFLENLSYGFDCLSMTAALSLAIACVVLETHRNLWRQWLMTSSGLLACMLLYQPAFGAYLPLALTAWLWRRTEAESQTGIKSDPIRSLVVMLSAPAASLLMTALMMNLFWHQRTDYARSSGDLKAPLQLVQDLIASILSYLQSLWSEWHNTSLLIVILLLSLGFILVFVARLRRHLPLTWSVLIAAAMPVILLCLAPGPMFLLNAVRFSDVPRMNAYIGGLLASLALPLASWASQQSRRTISRMAAITILLTWMWNQIVFSYAYGHAMQAQREFEQGRLSRLIFDISHLDPHRQARIIQFEGSMPMSPLLANTARKFPFINRLVPRMINGSWTWGAHQLSWYGLELRPAINEPANPADAARLQNCRNSDTMHCTSEHRILLAGEHLIVALP